MKKQRRIIFKVVDKNSRKGTNFVLSSIVLSSRVLSSIESPYIKTYEKDKVVKAVAGSLGIFTFTKRRSAVFFIKEYGLQSQAIILRVLPIGRGKCPKKIVSGGVETQRIEDFYQIGFSFYQDTMEPPSGTMCYPAVRILD